VTAANQSHQGKTLESTGDKLREKEKTLAYLSKKPSREKCGNGEYKRKPAERAAMLREGRGEMPSQPSLRQLSEEND